MNQTESFRRWELALLGPKAIILRHVLVPTIYGGYIPKNSPIMCGICCRNIARFNKKKPCRIGIRVIVQPNWCVSNNVEWFCPK